LSLTNKSEESTLYRVSVGVSAVVVNYEPFRGPPT